MHMHRKLPRSATLLCYRREKSESSIGRRLSDDEFVKQMKTYLATSHCTGKPRFDRKETGANARSFDSYPDPSDVFAQVDRTVKTTTHNEKIKESELIENRSSKYLDHVIPTHLTAQRRNHMKCHEFVLVDSDLVDYPAVGCSGCIQRLTTVTGQQKF
jgi:hypothetical protein